MKSDGIYRCYATNGSSVEFTSVISHIKPDGKYRCYATDSSLMGQNVVYHI